MSKFNTNCRFLSRLKSGEQARGFGLSRVRLHAPRSRRRHGNDGTQSGERSDRRARLDSLLFGVAARASAHAHRGVYRHAAAFVPHLSGGSARTRSHDAPPRRAAARRSANPVHGSSRRPDRIPQHSLRSPVCSSPIPRVQQETLVLLDARCTVASPRVSLSLFTVLGPLLRHRRAACPPGLGRRPYHA